MNAIMRFLKDEEGVTTIEYGLIAGLIAVVIIGGMQLVGDALWNGTDGIFDRLGTALDNTQPVVTP